MPQKRQRDRLFSRQGERCFYCNEPFDESYPPRMATIDEVVPRSKGGAKRMSNQVLAHMACNRAKADRMPTEYELERLAILIGERPLSPFVERMMDEIEAMDE